METWTTFKLWYNQYVASPYASREGGLQHSPSTSIDSIEGSLYAPLDTSTDNIRLLELTEYDPPNNKYRLREFPLKSCPPFFALSYTWGAPPAGREIIVNGRQVPVGENLWLALERIAPEMDERSRPWCSLDAADAYAVSMGLPAPESLCEDTWAYIWCDALCINQNDNVEKSHQVALMGRIYSTAAFVLAWLGIDKDSDLKDETEPDVDEIEWLDFRAKVCLAYCNCVAADIQRILQR